MIYVLITLRKTFWDQHSMMFVLDERSHNVFRTALSKCPYDIICTWWNVFVTVKQRSNYDKKTEHNFFGKLKINIQITLYFG